MAGTRKDASEAKKVDHQTVPLLKITENVNAILHPKNRFKFLYEDPNRTDAQVDEVFIKYPDLKLIEIYTGICCYRTNPKRIAALKHFEILIKKKFDDEDFVTETRTLTNILLSALIEQAITRPDLDELKTLFQKHKKDISYYSDKRYSFLNFGAKDSDHWNKINDELEEAYNRAIDYKIFGPVGARVNLGAEKKPDQTMEPSSPKKPYNSLN